MSKRLIKKSKSINSIVDEAISTIDCNIGGSCMLTAELITKALLENNVDDFTIIEGWVNFGNETYNPEDGEEDEENYFDINPDWEAHTWIELNGEKIDPTLIQFKKNGYNIENVEYKIKQTYNPEKYLILCGEEPGNLEKYKKKE